MNYEPAILGVFMHQIINFNKSFRLSESLLLLLLFFTAFHRDTALKPMLRGWISQLALSLHFYCYGRCSYVKRRSLISMTIKPNAMLLISSHHLGADLLHGCEVNLIPAFSPSIETSHTRQVQLKTFMQPKNPTTPFVQP